MVMVLQAIFVAHHLAIQLVDKFVDRCVEILVRTFCKHVAALDMDIALGALPSLLFFLFFYRKKYFDINHLVEVSNNSI